MNPALLIAAALIYSVLSGCSGAVRASCDGRRGVEPDFGAFSASPQVRVGSIPFPGLVSLYADADPADLGVHVYRTGVPFEDLGEVGRGIVYTRRAGFVDLAHVRNTIDNAAHIHARLRAALEGGWGCVQYRLFEPSVYRVEIGYPAAWSSLDEPTRGRLADEAAVRGAETLAVHSMTWHEILTWYGHNSTVVIPEKPSAFTYEDTVSHAVGARVAGEALRAAGAPGGTGFGEAVTVALDAALAELDAVGIDATRRAIDAVRGAWWSGLRVERRHVAGGVGGEPIVPWIVPGFGPGPGTPPATFELAPLDGLVDDPAVPTLRVVIDPRAPVGTRILRELRRARGLDTRPRVVDAETDFPMLLGLIRASIAEEAGPGALAPSWEVPAGTGF